uniref:Protein kinase domain-containing protein n=1 Tax=Percolomonas cosmopolitus TaxID=63605 RepID=A0A7S1PJ72_9EUKA|mmetsp:Transcript_9757/g.36345  ORF Transcript_9757/g.36345 Transcript_9757/m.36345 type:complete len:1286 (+) Transcript_9757:346-4203(+)
MRAFILCILFIFIFSSFPHIQSRQKSRDWAKVASQRRDLLKGHQVNNGEGLLERGMTFDAQEMQQWREERRVLESPELRRGAPGDEQHSTLAQNVTSRTIANTALSTPHKRDNEDFDPMHSTKCWGTNSGTGFFADGTISDKKHYSYAFRNTLGITREFAQVALSSGASYALTQEGILYSSGTTNSHLTRSYYDVPSNFDPIPFNDQTIIDIHAGRRHLLVLLASGLVLAKGANNVGQIGSAVTKDGTDQFISLGAMWWGTPIAGTDSVYNSLHPIRFSMIGAYDDSSIFTDGDNAWLLGRYVPGTFYQPVLVDYNTTAHGRIVDLSLGYRFYVLVNEFGEVYHCGVRWGITPSPGINTVPTKMAFTDPISLIQCGHEHCIALSAESHHRAWTFGFQDTTQGSLGDFNKTRQSFIPVEVWNPSGDTIISVSAARGFSSFTTESGHIYVWDALGVPSLFSSLPMLFETGQNFTLDFIDKERYGETYYYFGITTETHHLASMGRVLKGELGTGRYVEERTDFKLVEAVFMDHDAELLDVVQHGGKSEYQDCPKALALTKKRALYTWGCGNSRPRALDMTAFGGTSDDDSLSNVQRVHASPFVALVSTIDNRLLRLLEDDHPELIFSGDSTKNKILSVVSTKKSIWFSTEQGLYIVDAKLNHTRRITDGIITDLAAFDLETSSGQVFTLSDADVLLKWDELGTQSEKINTTYALPGDDLNQLCGGRSHLLILGTKGQPYALGDGWRAQLGTGDTHPREYMDLVDLRNVPSQAGLIVRVYSGGDESFLLTEQGYLFVWGRGTVVDALLIQSQFLTDTDTVLVPSPVTGLGDATVGKLGLFGSISGESGAAFAFAPYYCGEYLAADYRACSERGICGSSDYCMCNTGFGGKHCEQFICHELLEFDEKVCNGNGECIGIDVCKCNEGYRGDKCQIPITANDMWVYLVTFLSAAFILAVLASICIIVMSIAIIRRMRKKANLTARHLSLLQNKFEMEEMLDEDANKARMQLSSSMFEIKFSDIKLLKRVAVGGSGAVVWKSTWKGEEVALKIFKTSFLTGSTFFAEFEHEVKLLGSLQNPNIVRFFGACLDHPRIGVITEWCQQGSLVDCIRAGKVSSWSYREKLKLLSQIAHGIFFLHSKNIVHRDLKCDNVLIDEYNIAKIADFGLAKVIGSDQESNRMTMHIGTSYYIPPEVLHGKYDAKCDVYSFAIIIYEILVGELEPFKELVKEKSGIENIIAQNPTLRPSLNRISVPAEGNFLYGLIQRMWQHDPQNRPSMEEVVNIFDDAIIRR